MAEYIQLMYNFLQSTCLDVNIPPNMHVGMVLIALINVDPLVLQLDSMSTFSCHRTMQS